MSTSYKHLFICVVSVASVLTVATIGDLAGSATPWFVMLAGYGAVAGWSAYVLRSLGLSSMFRPRGGDLTLGIVTGLVLAGTAFFALRWIAPLDSPRSAWLFSVYLQFGNIQGEILRALGLLGVAVCEELVWRGLVQTHCIETWGARRGLPAAAGLYAVAHIPTLFTLQTAIGGLNPLLIVGALAFGLVWSVLVLFTGRLAPAIVCHVVTSYFVSAPAPEWLW